MGAAAGSWHKAAYEPVGMPKALGCITLIHSKGDGCRVAREMGFCVAPSNTAVLSSSKGSSKGSSKAPSKAPSRAPSTVPSMAPSMALPKVPPKAPSKVPSKGPSKGPSKAVPPKGTSSGCAAKHLEALPSLEAEFESQQVFAVCMRCGCPNTPPLSPGMEVSPLTSPARLARPTDWTGLQS